MSVGLLDGEVIVCSVASAVHLLAQALRDVLPPKVPVQCPWPLLVALAIQQNPLLLLAILHPGIAVEGNTLLGTTISNVSNPLHVHDRLPRPDTFNLL